MTGEKVCPACAETIKAAAIKCRYCGTDLRTLGADASAVPADATQAASGEGDDSAGELRVLATYPTSDRRTDSREAVEPVPAEPVTAEPLASVAEATDEVADERKQRAPVASGTASKKRGTLPLVALIAAQLVALGVAGWAYLDAREADQSDQARDTIRATISPQVEALFSYSAANFDEDVKAAEEALTADFRKEYRKITDDLRDDVIKESISQRAQVVAVSVLDAEPDEVEVFLYVNTTTANAKTERQGVRMSRMTATVEKVDGRWLIDDLSFPTN